jgi:quercetin dioxygenase-like cupin family protein
MKAGSLFLVAASLTAMCCVAQDAVKADSTHYSVIIENEHVRVLDIHYPPHSKGNMHSHPCSVTVFLTDGDLRMTLPDGKSMEGHIKAGQAVWEDAGSHQPENLSDKTFHAVRTELKNPQDCTK